MDLILASSDKVSLSTVLFKLINCPLYTTLHCLCDLQYKQWKSVLNSLKCDIPSDVLIILKWWFEHFVYKLCLVKVYEMKFAHGLITWAKFRPLKSTLKLPFQILIPSWLILICRLKLYSFVVIFIFRALHTVRYLDIKKLQSTISVQRELALNIHVKFLFLFSIHTWA